MNDRPNRVSPLWWIAVAGLAAVGTVATPRSAVATTSTADVSVEMVVHPDGTLFTMTVSNSGPDTAEDVTVHVESSLFASRGPGAYGICEFTSGWDCAVGPVAPGGTVAISMTVDLFCAQDITASATVSTTSVDPDPDDNAVHRIWDQVCTTYEPDPDPCSDEFGNNTCSVCIPSVSFVDAGPDQDVTENDNVQLAGASWEESCDVANPTWTQIGGPPVTLVPAPIPTFVAPSVNGTTQLVFQLTVLDGSDTVTITVHDGDTTPPTVAVTGVAATTYLVGGAPAAGCSTTDDESGVAVQASLSTTGGPTGSITATCSGAMDVAGNAADAVSIRYRVADLGFGGFLAPTPGATIRKPTLFLPVTLTLVTASGRPIPAMSAFFLSFGRVRVTLSGPGVASRAATCWWSGPGRFQCVLLVSSSRLRSGTNYSLSASVDIGGGFVALPTNDLAQNPMTIRFT